MILDTLTSLQIILDGAAADVDIHVDYQDWNLEGMPTSPSTKRSASNGANDVTILDAPTNNARREPLRISFYNGNGSTKIITLKTDDGSTERIILKASLTTLKATMWEKGTQWQFNV